MPLSRPRAEGIPSAGRPHRRRRRSGSSPWLELSTPSTPPTTSWTIFRSVGVHRFELLLAAGRERPGARPQGARLEPVPLALLVVLDVDDDRELASRCAGRPRPASAPGAPPASGHGGRSAGPCPRRPGSGPSTSTYIVPSSRWARPWPRCPSWPGGHRRSLRRDLRLVLEILRGDLLAARRRTRTTTTASWAPIPNRPWRGSCWTSTSASCSVTPSSAESGSEGLLNAWGASSDLLHRSCLRVRAYVCWPGLGEPGFGAPGLRVPELGRLVALLRVALLSARSIIEDMKPFFSGLLLAVGSGCQRLGRRPALEHEVLLTDLPRVRRRPVEHQAGGEEDPEDAEHERHDLEQRLLLW